MVTVENVSVGFGKKLVLEQFHWTVPETGFTCMTGPSGCGKTTLFRVLAGLQKPDAGVVRGISRDQIAFLFQEDRLLPWRTAEENIRDVLPKEQHEKSDYWLELVELLEEKGSYPGELSGGMRRRVALARALAYGLARPGRLLLMDEPFSGLDAPLRIRLIASIRTLPLTALVITHDWEEIRLLADHVIRWDGPPLRLVAQGAAETNH